MDLVFPARVACVFSSVTLWISLSVFFTQSVSDTHLLLVNLWLFSQLAVCFHNIKSSREFTCYFFFFFFFVPFPASVCLLSSSFFHCLFSLIITLIPLTFSSVRLPWNKLHHDNTHILDHILHHLDSCSLAQPLQFSMVLIITYSIMQFFSAISF